MVPQFIMMRALGLYDTIWALVVLQSFSAFGVFLMRQFYLGIPNELSEAARIDGLSEYGIWARIMLPLAKPAIATLCIFTFVNTWNDYMGPMIYLTTDVTDEEAVYKDGFVMVPNKPGLGIEVDEEYIQTKPYAPRILRHYTGTLTDIRAKDDTIYYFKGWDK